MTSRRSRGSVPAVVPFGAAKPAGSVDAGGVSVAGPAGVGGAAGGGRLVRSGWPVGYRCRRGPKDFRRNLDQDLTGGRLHGVVSHERALDDDRAVVARIDLRARVGSAVVVGQRYKAHVPALSCGAPRSLRRTSGWRRGTRPTGDRPIGGQDRVTRFEHAIAEHAADIRGQQVPHPDPWQTTRRRELPGRRPSHARLLIHASVLAWGVPEWVAWRLQLDAPARFPDCRLGAAGLVFRPGRSCSSEDRYYSLCHCRWRVLDVERAAEEVGAMELVPLAQSSCGTSTCPGVFEASDGSVVVQGYVVPTQRYADGVPDGEARVQIPRDLLIRAARSLPDWDGQ